MPEPMTEDTARRLEERLDDLSAVAKLAMIAACPLLLAVLGIDRAFQRWGIRRDIFWWPLRPPPSRSDERRDH